MTDTALGCSDATTDLPRGTNPMLAPLEENGGGTRTFRLLHGSPALDAGASGTTTDQRGVPRPQGPAVDIGAYEVPWLDLRASGIADTPVVVLGEVARFRFTISNPSPTALAVGARSVANLPAGMTLAGLVVSEGTCMGSARQVECAFGILPPLAGISVEISATTSAVGTFATVASVVSDDVETAPADNLAAATVTVVPPGPQPPSGLIASSIVGNSVTLRWSPPALGAAPTGYVLEGGVSPGEVLASIPTGGASPVYTVTVPSGTFHVRVHTLAGSSRSGPSNEIRIVVNVPESPSAPANLLGLVNGSALGLAWQNTFAGGAPTSLLLDVTGAISASIPLGLSETFSYPDVPAGTYTMRLRAVNDSGTSDASNPVTLTFPGSCSGVPLPPAAFLAYRIGTTIYVLWDPPASGPAPAGYVLNVTGAYVGTVATTSRSLSGTVGPGSYTLSVAATNECGDSAPTPAQTVTIP